jgi:hypothetical protein
LFDGVKQIDSTWILGRYSVLQHSVKSHMGQSGRRWLIRNQNTIRIDERAVKKSRKEDCGTIHENVHSVRSVAALS